MSQGQDQTDPARILVVDDEAVVRDILADFLNYEGFAVTTSGSTTDALEQLAKEHFDLLLTDLKVPQLDGLALLRSVRDSGGDTQTVIMTGYGTVETALEALKQGAFDYIMKPFRPEEVIQVLRRALDQQRLQRENFQLRESVGFYELSEALASAMPLDQQLELVVDLTVRACHAAGVEILTEDPARPGVYDVRAARGPQAFAPRVPKLLQSFIVGERVRAHGPDVVRWLEHPATADYEVQAFMAAPLRMRGAPFGVITAYRFDGRRPFTEGERKGLTVFAGRAANAIETSRMYGNLSETFTGTMEGFARALEAKDPYTHGHSDRVAMYARLIAEQMSLPERDCQRIEHGGYVHDIGKIGLRSAELNKAQKLTPREYLMFQSHPVKGRRIIEPITFLVQLLPCVYHHHEMWDGSGYPEGLGGVDIPLDARILAVADTYDAMTSDRPYRKALPHDIALAEVKRCAGRQFDPTVAEAFLVAIGPFRKGRRERGLPVPD